MIRCRILGHKVTEETLALLGRIDIDGLHEHDGDGDVTPVCERCGEQLSELE